MLSAGHTERAMLYHELQDGMYSVTSYFFAKVKSSDKTESPAGASLVPCWSHCMLNSTASVFYAFLTVVYF